MTERKVVRRTIAIALVVVCVLLLSGLVFAIAYHSSYAKNKDEALESKDFEIANLQGQIANLQGIVSLQMLETVVYERTINQASRDPVAVVALQFPCAGYLHITTTSTTAYAYVLVQYWFQGTLFSTKKTTDSNGDIIVPVLPSTSATIYVGNDNPSWWGGDATHTISIEYHY